MKRTGISAEGFGRLSKKVAQTAVVKPKVLSAKKYVYSGSGYTSPPGDYDAFQSTSMADMDKLWGGTPLTTDEVVAWTEKNLGADFSHLAAQPSASEDYLMMSIQQKNELEEGNEDEEDEGPSVTGLLLSEVTDTLDTQKLGMGWNTTYNWGWFGPDMTFNIYSAASDPLWGEAVVIVGLGTSRPGDTGKAYLVDGVAESAPFHDISMGIDIETDQGTISLRNEDSEAYYFDPDDDGRNLLMKAGWDGHQLTIDMLDDLLDWGGSSADRSINL